MTTTDTALREQIAEAMFQHDHPTRLDGWDHTLLLVKTRYRSRADAVLPIIRKAQADALREAANAIDLEAIADEWSRGSGNSSDMHWSAGNAASTVQIRLFARAREIEREAP